MCAQGDGLAALDPVGVLIEACKVEAEVKDSKVDLVIARAKEVRAQAGATPNHLPELDLRVHRLEEDQVCHFRNVDAGVEHVYRDGKVWVAVLLLEGLDQAVRVRVVVVDHASKVARVVGVVVIEAFLDELGMVVIASEDDGLG